MPNQLKHPDYDEWVKVYGKMHADDENRAWLSRSLSREARDNHARTQTGRFEWPWRNYVGEDNV